MVSTDFIYNEHSIIINVAHKKNIKLSKDTLFAFDEYPSALLFSEIIYSEEMLDRRIRMMLRQKWISPLEPSKIKRSLFEHKCNLRKNDFSTLAERESYIQYLQEKDLLQIDNTDFLEIRFVGSTSENNKYRIWHICEVTTDDIYSGPHATADGLTQGIHRLVREKIIGPQHIQHIQHYLVETGLLA